MEREQLVGGSDWFFINAVGVLSRIVEITAREQNSVRRVVAISQKCSLFHHISIIHHTAGSVTTARTRCVWEVLADQQIRS